MITEIRNNDEARDLIASKGITSDNVTSEQLGLLHAELVSSLNSSGFYDGTYTMNPIGNNEKYMTCRCKEWDSREAVSFNSDGFIGFAGWASTANAKPILDAVKNWLNKVS